MQTIVINCLVVCHIYVIREAGSSKSWWELKFESCVAAGLHIKISMN